MPLFAHWRHTPFKTNSQSAMIICDSAAAVSPHLQLSAAADVDCDVSPSGVKKGWPEKTTITTTTTTTNTKDTTKTTNTTRIITTSTITMTTITDHPYDHSTQKERAVSGEEEEDETHMPKSKKKAGSIFCGFDEGIEMRLRDLHHTAQSMLHRDGVQAEIDTYLVACISPVLCHLVLPRNNVPHYDNLPDISSYALGVLDPAMDSDPELQQVLLLLRQCMPLRRRTKRAQREVQWRQESCFAIQTLLRCMQGTLLGLYPNCLKGIAFGARVGILQFLRTLIVQPFEKLDACMQRIPYITKLCVMEHLCNTIYDYHPGVCHTLNRSGQKVEHFCNSVSTICDIFRGELNTLYCAAVESASTAAAAADTSFSEADAILQILPKLEKIGHSYFERCTRAYRGIIIGNAQPSRSIDQVKRLLPSKLAATGTNMEDILSQILEKAYMACNQSVFDLTHVHSLPNPKVRELAWHIMHVVQVLSSFI